MSFRRQCEIWQVERENFFPQRPYFVFYLPTFLEIPFRRLITPLPYFVHRLSWLQQAQWEVLAFEDRLWIIDPKGISQSITFPTRDPINPWNHTSVVFIVGFEIHKIGSVLIKVIEAFPECCEPLLTVEEMLGTSRPNVIYSRNRAALKFFLVANVQDQGGANWKPSENHL